MQISRESILDEIKHLVGRLEKEIGLAVNKSRGPSSQLKQMIEEEMKRRHDFDGRFNSVASIMHELATDENKRRKEFNKFKNNPFAALDEQIEMELNKRVKSIFLSDE